MATRASVLCWEVQKYGQMDRQVSDGQNADVVWWCWFPGRAFLSEFLQWLPSCMVIQGANVVQCGI